MYRLHFYSDSWRIAIIVLFTKKWTKLILLRNYRAVDSTPWHALIHELRDHGISSTIVRKSQIMYENILHKQAPEGVFLPKGPQTWMCPELDIIRSLSNDI